MKSEYAKAKKAADALYTKLTGRRNPARQKKEILIAVWIPVPLVRALDKAAKARDTDRSKLIREALRKELAFP